MAGGAKGVGMDEVGFALAGVALGGVSMKLGRNIAKIYESTGRASQLKSVLTLTGGRTKVAPGIFTMGGRAATGQSLGTTASEVGTRAVKLHVDAASHVTTGVRSLHTVDKRR